MLHVVVLLLWYRSPDNITVSYQPKRIPRFNTTIRTISVFKRYITFYSLIYSSSFCGGKRCFIPIVSTARFRNLLSVDCYAVPGFVRTTLPAGQIKKSGRRTTSAPGILLKIVCHFRLLSASETRNFEALCASTTFATMLDTRVC